MINLNKQVDDGRPEKIYTYDILLTNYFQTFGSFANHMDKPLDEIRKYFSERLKERKDVQIMGEYVRLNVDNFKKEE